jgi:hypothetical protein
MIYQILLFFLLLLTSAPAGPLAPPLSIETSYVCISPKRASGASPQTATARRGASWIIDRTVQTLWQTNLFLRPGKGSRPKVLFVRQSTRSSQTGNGLRSTSIQGARGAASSKLQGSARNPGRHLQHQSRTTIPKGRTVNTKCRRFPHQRSP